MTNLKLSKRLSMLMVVVMLITMVPLTSFAAANDLEGHWSQSVVENWLNQGMIKGYPDGSFKPDKTITRAEFMAIVNKAFNLTEEADISFTDVKANDWYYKTVKLAKAAGYINGYPDGTMKPNSPVTRQEAAVMLGIIKKLTPNSEKASVFKDAESLPDWSKGYIGALADAGYFKGYEDGTFRASNSMKRAEAVVSAENIIKVQGLVYEKAGTYGPATGTETIKNSVVVKADGTTLQNLIIKGNLTIDESVKEGTVNLNNVTVEGQTLIKGGGKDSVKINGGGYGKVFVMKQADTPVRLLVVNVKNLDVVIPQEAGGGQIVLEGVFNSVSVLAPKVQLSTQGNTTINEIKFDKLALEVKVNLGSGTVVMKLITEVVLTVLGQGRIVVADVRVTGVTFEKLPETVNTTINGQTTTTTNTGGGTSTGGSTGGTSTGGGAEIPQAVAPVITPGSKYVSSGSSVTLHMTSVTTGASIYYSVNGGSYTLFTTSSAVMITISGDTTVTAYTTAPGYGSSGVTEVKYYTTITTADLNITTGSAVFTFDFKAGPDGQRVNMTYAEAIALLVSSESSVKLEFTSGGAAVTSGTALLSNLSINSGTGAFSISNLSALQSAFTGLDKTKIPALSAMGINVTLTLKTKAGTTETITVTLTAAEIAILAGLTP